MAKKRLNITNSAYGQLVLLVFLPICLLAGVGAALVYYETIHAHKREQEALAKAILIRNQPLVQKQLSSIIANPDANQELNSILYSLQTESELQSVAVVDNSGNILASSGFKLIKSWGDINSLTNLAKDGFVNNIRTSAGTAYGIELKEHNGQLMWLFVDMDNQPLRLAKYRVALVLIATGLLTILLLLLALNIYSRRWIEPIYQLRLYLQSTSLETLQTPLTIKSDGELNLLKEDIVMTLTRLRDSFRELKDYSEQTEDDLRLAFDEMEMQNISIRNSRDRAISTSEAKSAFLANISHELRTPLNSIDGFINLLARNGDLSAEQDLYVQTIRKSSAHLLALVNDVLDFSKIEAGKLVLDSHEFNLYDAVYDVVDMLSPVASEKGLRMAVLFYNDVPLSMVGDALRLKQVLTNLVANAIKFTDSGDILVKVSLDDMKDNHLTVTIQDSGRGVPEQVQSQLFKSFSQGDPSITRQYGGTGLGLVISKQLVQLMGGDIGFYDNHKEHIASQGSTFWFVLPTNVDVLEVENASDIKLPLLRKSNQNSLRRKRQGEKSLQILLWINHPASMQVLCASLQPLDVEVTQTYSLVATLDKLKEHTNKWDWVIVDGNINDARTQGNTNIDKPTDDMTALLKQLRLHYQGRLAVYGYQVALDNQLLARYKTYALHEPLDKRQLYYMLDEKIDKTTESHIDVTPRWQGYRVLAVDDHLPNLLVLDALLAEQGIEVITASSGYDAIEIVSKQFANNNSEHDEKAIDLIFMDIQMPRMSGHEASEQIRKINHSEPHIPIIALTAHGMSDERDKLMKSGIDDYVGKPISQSQLSQILQKWLGKKTDNKIDIAVENIGNSITHAINQTDMESITTVTALSTIKSSANLTMPVSDIQEYPVIDWEDALHRSANKPELASKLIIMMIDSVNDERESITQAWTNKDIEQLGQVAHRILGASRYTGVPALRHTSEKLEKNCLSSTKNRAGKNLADIDWVNLTNDYHDLLNALDNLQGIDLSPWPQLRYQRLDEDDMNWKMI